MWRPHEWTTLRAAWFQTVKRPFSSNQTIEPTQVAGFNQFFDDPDGAKSERYGIALDQAFSVILKGGIEFTWRDLTVRRFITGVAPDVVRLEQEEEAYRAYIYWTPAKSIALAGEYFFESFSRSPETLIDQGQPLKLVQHRIPLSLSYYSPSGMFATLTASYVNQDVVLDSAEGVEASKGDSFWVLDTILGYRLPKRMGILRFGVTNLLDETFCLADVNFNPLFGELVDEPMPAMFTPERAVFFQATVAF